MTLFIHDFFSYNFLMTFCSSFDMAAGSQQAAVTESLNASQDKCLYDKSSSWKFIFC